MSSAPPAIGVNSDPQFLCDENKSAFQILQVPEGCENDQLIRDHYFAIAKNIHPDKAKNPEDKEANEVAMKKVNAAYASIKNTEARRIYAMAKNAVSDEKIYTNDMYVYRVSTVGSSMQERVEWPDNINLYWKNWCSNLLMKPMGFADAGQITYDPHTFTGYLRFIVIPFTLRLRIKLVFEAKSNEQDPPKYTKEYTLNYDFPYQMASIVAPKTIEEVENIFFAPNSNIKDPGLVRSAQQKIDKALADVYFCSDDTRVGQRESLNKAAAINEKRVGIATEVLRAVDSLKCNPDLPKDFEMILNTELSKASKETGLTKLFHNAELDTVVSTLCSPVEVEKIRGKFGIKNFRFCGQLPPVPATEPTPEGQTTTQSAYPKDPSNIDYTLIGKIKGFTPESAFTQEQQVAFAQLCTTLIAFITQAKGAEFLEEFSREVQTKYGEMPDVFLPNKKEPTLRTYAATHDEGTEITVGWPTNKAFNENDIVQRKEREDFEAMYAAPFCIEVPVLLVLYHRIKKTRIFMLNLITGEAAGTYSLSKTKLALGIGAAAVASGVSQITKGFKKLVSYTKRKIEEKKEGKATSAG